MLIFFYQKGLHGEEMQKIQATKNFVVNQFLITKSNYCNISQTL